MRAGLGLILSIVLLSSCDLRKGNGSIGAGLGPADKEYCREISFPQGWRYPLKDNNGSDYPTPFEEYEFREGSVLGEFLVAGSFESTFSPRYTTSKYRVNFLSEQPKVIPIDEGTWENTGGKTSSLQRNSIFPERSMTIDDRAEFRGKLFPRTGKLWSTPGQAATRLSPDESWLVLQSLTGPGRGKVFFDVFNVSTGAKLLTLQLPLEGAWPDGLINRTGWLAGRYFVIPTGEDFESSVVCEFDRGTK